MALTKCKECGDEVSIKAEFCPTCGAKDPTGRIVREKVFAGCLAVIVICVFVFICIKNCHITELVDAITSVIDTDKDTYKVQSQSPTYKLSADALFAEYRANEVAADTKYKGKVVVVSGVIQNIGKDIIDRAYIVIGDLNGIQCLFTESQNASVARLAKGQQVTVKGEVDGEILLTVLMSKCTLCGDVNDNNSTCPPSTQDVPSGSGDDTIRRSKVARLWKDTIVFKNGARIEGNIIKEDDKEITIEVKGGSVTIKKSQIANIEKKK